MEQPPCRTVSLLGLWVWLANGSYTCTWYPQTVKLDVRYIWQVSNIFMPSVSHLQLLKIQTHPIYGNLYLWGPACNLTFFWYGLMCYGSDTSGFWLVILNIIYMGNRSWVVRNSFNFLLDITTIPSNVIECIYKIECRPQIWPSNTNAIFKCCQHRLKIRVPTCKQLY